MGDKPRCPECFERLVKILDITLDGTSVYWECDDEFCEGADFRYIVVDGELETDGYVGI